jgi:aromatic-L-amino-acid/L-tryptophan decarboxylase
MEEEVTQHVGLVGYLHNLVCEHPDFEVLCGPTVDLWCFRYLPNGLPADQREVQQQLDRLNADIVESVQREGFALINKTQVGSSVAIRISISSQKTVRDDIDATFEAIARWGRLLTRKQLVTCELTRDMESKLCLSESHSSSTEVSVT